jgi:hypothetical protein
MTSRSRPNLRELLAQRNRSPEEIERENRGLLGLIESHLRTMPDEVWDKARASAEWLGATTATVHEWDPIVAIEWDSLVRSLESSFTNDFQAIAHGLRRILYRARSALALEVESPTATFIDSGATFTYFDALRQIIERARVDLLIVDPYLDAEFVSRYLPAIAGGTQIRLLTRERLNTLIPAVEAFVGQYGSQIAVRSCSELHDRFVFVDGQSCHLSGASLKDGAKTAPTVLVEIIDVFASTLSTYEALWNSATIIR